MANNKSGLTAVGRVMTAIISIIMILAGFYLFYDKKSIVMIFGGAAAVFGLALLIKYAFSKSSRSALDLIGGIINIIFGALMLLGGTETKIAGVIAIEVYIAVWVLIAGFSHIFTSFALKKAGLKGWAWTLIGGVIAVIAGAAFIIWPFMGSVSLVGFGAIYAGISFIVLGVTGLAGAISPAEKKRQ